MEQQASTTDLDIPKIVPFLANMVLELNGLTSEGIFRVPGDADDVTELVSFKRRHGILYPKDGGC
jgi:hypothetical protein